MKLQRNSQRTQQDKIYFRLNESVNIKNINIICIFVIIIILLLTIIIFNRPGSAWAVLQTPLSLTDYKSLSDPLWKYFRIPVLPKPKELGVEILREFSFPTFCHISHATCRMSHVMRHMSCVTCHVSHVRCHMSCVTFH